MHFVTLKCKLYQVKYLILAKICYLQFLSVEWKEKRIGLKYAWCKKTVKKIYTEKCFRRGEITSSEIFYNGKKQGYFSLKVNISIL